MLIDKFVRLVGWDAVKEAALSTVGKKPITSEPTSEWKRHMLLAEHSPIRLLQYAWWWKQIKMWVTVHFARHHEGCEKFINTQRSDRTGIPRDELPQGTENSMEMMANAQSLINISRKRLCANASKETREAWLQVKAQIEAVDPEMASCMVRECVYRGFCPEFSSNPKLNKCCGYCNTEAFKKEVENYRKQ